MANPLVAYLHDHLAGAKFAISLLQDLSEQTLDADTAALAVRLIAPIEADRAVVENLASELGEDASALKESMAWFAQKASRLKLTMSKPEGVFEAVEVLSLGVLGKLALWNTLRALSDQYDAVSTLDLAALQDRAVRQHAALEELRCRLAALAFVPGTKP